MQKSFRGRLSKKTDAAGLCKCTGKAERGGKKTIKGQTIVKMALAKTRGPGGLSPALSEGEGEVE